MKLDRRNIILVLVIVFVLFVSWQFTVKNTFDYKNQIEALGVESLQKDQKEYELLVSRKKFLDRKIRDQNISQLGVRASLFQLIDKKGDIEIVSYNDDVKLQSTNTTTTYHQVEIKGEYNDLISLLDQLLEKNKSTRLINLKFENFKERYNSNIELRLRLILLKTS